MRNNLQTHASLPKFIGIFVLILFVGGCMEDAESAQGNPRYDRLYTQLSQVQSDPQKLEFLTEEAVRAGVRDFELMTSTNEYGWSDSNGLIKLSTALPGGTGVINITHEIAHVVGYRRGCNGHKKCWIKNYLEIAERHEARFPGERWSGVTPTQRVLRNVTRYDITM